MNHALEKFLDEEGMMFDVKKFVDEELPAIPFLRMQIRAESDKANLYNLIHQAIAQDRKERGAGGEADTVVAREYINVIFDGPPSNKSGRFVETETDDGKGIAIGEWIERPDGLWALRIPLGGDVVARLIIAYSSGYEEGHHDTVEGTFQGNGRPEEHDEAAQEWLNEATADGTLERDCTVVPTIPEALDAAEAELKPTAQVVADAVKKVADMPESRMHGFDERGTIRLEDAE